MKSSVTTSETFKYILIFTFLFSAFLALAITYNKVYRLKNETLLIIEKYEGISEKSLGIINNYLSNSGYNTTGNCEVDEYGIKDLNISEYERVTDTSERYYYCISYYCKDKNICKVGSIDSFPNGNSIYYEIKLFYKFNLPFLGDLFRFKITGESKAIKLYSESQKLN